jgi:hypothetical protein
MGTDKRAGRAYAARPIKGAGDRRRRVKVQLRRLIALGVPEAKATAMTAGQVRELLKRPKLVASALRGMNA